MDMETYTNTEGNHISYLIVAYDGNDYITSYINKQKQTNVGALFHDFITKLINKCWDNSIHEM
jgi:hypothetical protein